MVMDNEKRLVDANSLCQWLNEKANDYSLFDEYAAQVIRDDMEIVQEQPAVDAVEVVRCRECKHYDTADFDGNILCGCTLHSAMLDITPDSFCSYGERKEGSKDG